MVLGKPKCVNCGTVFFPEDVFCKKCGAKINHRRFLRAGAREKEGAETAQNDLSGLYQEFHNCADFTQFYNSYLRICQCLDALIMYNEQYGIPMAATPRVQKKDLDLSLQSEINSVIDRRIDKISEMSPALGKWGAAAQAFQEVEENTQFSSMLQEGNRLHMQEIIKPLIAEYKVNVADESGGVWGFIFHYDKVNEALENLSKFKTSYIYREFRIFPELELKTRREELQLHLCNMIAKERDQVILDIKQKYKNSLEFQQNAARKFANDIELNRSRLSEGTLRFSSEAISAVYRAAKLKYEYEEEETLENGLSSIDGMDGHDFEEWCADLLRKNGFFNVEVTPGSGDQGVDVIAEKDGIKYAVQCKCYSSDLGNTPVQEVNAGKIIYHCHVGVVMTNRHFTKGAKDAAEATGVLLWDREKLEEMINN